MFSARKKTLVNLLPKTEFESSFSGKFLHWSIFYGRYLIILTEIVVILAFMMRFKVDADLSNLNDAIAGKANIIAANMKFETEYIGIQNRLNEAGKIIADTPVWQILDQITTQVPESIKITTLTIGNRGFSLSATGDQSGFNTFVDRVLSQKNFKNLNLSNISYDSNSAVKFSLKATY